MNECSSQGTFLFFAYDPGLRAKLEVCRVEIYVYVG